jgi:hypothetical protein
MHRTAIGTPTPKASPKRQAEEEAVSPTLPEDLRNALISHQTGAEFLMLEFQTMELMK